MDGFIVEAIETYAQRTRDEPSNAFMLGLASKTMVETEAFIEA